MKARLIAALVVAALLGGMTGADARGGTGDPVYPNLGTAAIDVLHYDIALTWHAAQDEIDATTTLTSRAKTALTSFELDLVGTLAVTSVVVGGSNATFGRAGNKLVITPSAPVAAGAQFTTTVVYGGKPTHLGKLGNKEGWIVKDVGAIVLGEPRGSMTWFPNNNRPSDKATYDLALEVPEEYQAVSNGRNTSVVPSDEGRTWHWAVAEPMASYLATAAIGKYDRHTRTVDGIRYDSFIAREARSHRRPLRLMPRIVRQESKWFGRYPFSDAGMIVDNASVFYALELQNRPFYPGFADTPTLVHELAHQWFGNSVTPRTWNHIWLSEGFATYAEWLWAAHQGGPSVRQAYRRELASFSRWSPAPLDITKRTLFHPTVYYRGAMTLQALRERIGTRSFFRLVRRWTAERRHATGTTAAFKRLAEQVSGKQLDRLFRDWLARDRKPRGYA